MTLKYIWRSFQPRLSFPRPFQRSSACFRVARSPSNTWASCFENCMTLWRMVAKLWCINFQHFFWKTVYVCLCFCVSTGWLKINTPQDNMQYLRNQWSDFKNSWGCLILTVFWIQRYTMYPLYLNYATTLPRKTITMKITICIIVLVLKWNKTCKFDISDCHSLFEDVFSVQLPVLLAVFRRDHTIS